MLPADVNLARVHSLCFEVGAVLRIEGAEPGTVSVDAPELVSQFYEAGAVEIRFIYSGTLFVSIVRGGKTFKIAVVVL